MTTWKEASEDLKARTESKFKVNVRRYFEAFEDETENYQDAAEQYNQAWIEFMDLCADAAQIDIDITRHIHTLNFKLTNAFPVLQNLLNTQPLFTLNYTADYRQNDFNDWLDNAGIEDKDTSFKVWALGELSDAITRGIQDLVSRNLLQVAQTDDNVKFWEELTKLYSVIGDFMAKVAEKALDTHFEENPEEELEPAKEIPEEVNELVSSVETPEETEHPFEESQKLKEAYWNVENKVYKAFEKLMKLEGVKRYACNTSQISPDWAGNELLLTVVWDGEEVPEQEVKDYLKAKEPSIKFRNSWDNAFEHALEMAIPESVWGK